MRPSPHGTGASRAGRRISCESADPRRVRMATPFPFGEASGVRQEVSERNRVGAKLSARAIAPEGALQGWSKGRPRQKPLTRDHSASLLCQRRQRIPPREWRLGNRPCISRRRVPSVRWSCLRIVFDCRSRRAACGVKRPRVMSPRKAGASSPKTFGLSGRKSVGSRARAAKHGSYGGGLASEVLAFLKRLRGPSGHSSMKGVPSRESRRP